MMKTLKHKEVRNAPVRISLFRGFILAYFTSHSCLIIMTVND